MKPPPLTGPQVERWMKRHVMARHREALSHVWESGGKEQVDRMCRETAEKLNQIKALFQTLQLP